MHDVRRLANRSPGDLTNCLMAQAHAEERCFESRSFQRPPQNVETDSRFFRCAGTGRKHDPCGIHALNFANRDLVVASDFDVGSALAQVLDEVVCKGVKVVDDQDHPFIVERAII